MKTIETIEQAREYFAELHTEPGAVEWVLHCYNCTEADIDATGDVWIEGPQRGHWLSDDELIDLANRIEAGI